ncbi:hypothetical protein [Gulosibacter chungangensis]|uniref:Glucosyltransferase 3-like C-terminal domain-containing protein n=1 Tax=Gulosibacter chungangensis TaxID=979746 RepID=A0A7J5B7D4_9MICO|nr:hypothetical protein [Gulosibacter chungangensis]KAB1640827.1 hypothetical protein F8O05_14095 [Gulosibacter chungangensis]
MAWLTTSARRKFAKPANWITSVTLQKFGNQIASYFNQVIDVGGHDVVMASGLSANGIAKRHISLPFIPLLWREDLDFSRSRAIFSRRFGDLTSGAEVLFLEDDYEFDKALSKGSQSAHLLHPQFSFEGLPKLLTEGAATARIAVVYPEGSNGERIEAYEQMFNAVAAKHGASVNTIAADALFRARDLTRNRSFHETAVQRLEHATHMVLVGSSKHASSLGAYLVDTTQGDRLIAEDTIGLSRWGRQIGFKQLGRGSRLAKLLDDVLTGSLKQERSARIVETGEPIAVLRNLVEQQYPSSFEQLNVTENEGPFNVFFSTTGLEDRTDGARPQRIRNMAEALDSDTPTVRIASNVNGFRRRRDFVLDLISAGRKAEIFYGENSTSPIPSADIREELGDFLRKWREAGGRSAWFVRDLHWLDPKAGIAQAADGTDGIIANGLHELNHVGGAADLLLAPDPASVEGFKRLLAGHDAPSTPWVALPPGVAPENVLESGTLRDKRNGPTLLYAGGVGAVYAMTNLLTAMQTLVENEFFVDFVVRPGETEQLLEELASFGLAEHPRVSVSTNSLDVYLPSSELTIGAVLLDSEYARFSFPYKTISMIEKGFPVITYSDMAIAAFVEHNMVGAATQRDTDSLVETLERMSNTDYQAAISAARESESWSARVQQVKQFLDNIVER